MRIAGIVSATRRPVPHQVGITKAPRRLLQRVMAATAALQLCNPALLRLPNRQRIIKHVRDSELPIAQAPVSLGSRGQPSDLGLDLRRHGRCLLGRAGITKACHLRGDDTAVDHAEKDCGPRLYRFGRLQLTKPSIYQRQERVIQISHLSPPLYEGLYEDCKLGTKNSYISSTSCGRPIR